MGETYSVHGGYCQVIARRGTSCQMIDVLVDYIQTLILQFDAADCFQGKLNRKKLKAIAMQLSLFAKKS